MEPEKKWGLDASSLGYGDLRESGLGSGTVGELVVLRNERNVEHGSDDGLKNPYIVRKARADWPAQTWKHGRVETADARLGEVGCGNYPTVCGNYPTVNPNETFSMRGEDEVSGETLHGFGTS